MSETEPGAHTIKTHGAKVAKKHMHDWLILLLLVVIDIVLNVIHPFYRFVGKDMMIDLKYPLKGNTVPVWAVPRWLAFPGWMTIGTINWQDVFAGGLLGFSIATFCYLQFFPPPYHTQGWGPYVRALEKFEKLRLNARLGHPSNGPNVQAAGAQFMTQQMGRVGNAFTPEPEEDKSSDAFIPVFVGHKSSSSEVDIEHGRR
ncbi:hypothetical protein RHGRI_026830 [Rhododendron griersonianum]|uniref:Uncharacterized protein n=1 Tax=Rhododendron griersonianum TaxID=479676 RepID=A0AAV6IU82_9ERIC|nr:hypothetical protein RHGRI_026830 [Rhododendron griersonianum]